jgi:hypothetical protein
MDELQCLQNEKYLLDMMSVAVVERKVCVLIDHTIFLLNLRSDMVSRSNDGNG